jgi:hypothetical protein
MGIFHVEIGKFPVSIDLPDSDARLEPSYLNFLSTRGGKPDGKWRVETDSIPAAIKALVSASPPFPHWEIVKGINRKVFRLRKREISPDLWKAARMDRGLSRGEIWTDHSKDNAVHPLRGLDQLLFSHFLLPRGALIIHAAAARIAGRGFLFPAPSGGGKSTWANLMKTEAGGIVLGEDKVVLRKSGGPIRLFGSPWNPRRGFRVNDSAPLQGIFFLRPGRANALRPLGPMEALREIIQQAFLPFPESEELEDAVTLLEAITGSVPSFRFEFRPDRSAVDYFRKQIAGEY